MFKKIVSRTMVFLTVGSLALLAAGCSNSPGGEGADDVKEVDVVTLKYADTSNAKTVEHRAKPFMEKISELAKERGKEFNIDYYPNSELGSLKDQVSGLQNGIFDIGTVHPTQDDNMRLSGVIGLPQLSDKGGILAAAFHDVITDENSVFYKTDYEANGIMALAGFSSPLYEVATVKQPMSSTEFLKGMTIRSGGGSQDLVIKALGGTPVPIPAKEQYQALERGIVDGGIFNIPSTTSNKTAEVFNYLTTNADLSAYPTTTCISLSSWNALPSWAKEVLKEAGDWIADKEAGPQEEEDQAELRVLKDEFGTELTTLSQGTLDRMRALLKPVSQEWVKEVNSLGLDGDLALKQFQKAVAKHS